MKPIDIVWIGLGGGLGSVLRCWIGRVVGDRYHGDFALGTFLINASGAVLIGYLSVLFGIDSRDRYGAALNSGVPDGANSLMGTGIAGGLSTFSSFAYGVVVLATASATGAFVSSAYVVVSLVMGYVAVVAGLTLGGKD
jgi:CrcB protein